MCSILKVKIAVDVITSTLIIAWFDQCKQCGLLHIWIHSYKLCDNVKMPTQLKNNTQALKKERKRRVFHIRR